MTGAFSDGDQVMLGVNGVDYQGAVDGQGHFSIDMLGADLKADPDATLEGLLVTTDADGNQQTFDFTQSLGDLSSAAPTADGAAVDAATADAATADRSASRPLRAHPISTASGSRQRPFRLALGRIPP